MTQTLKVRYELREDPAAVWATKNPVLRRGEPGVEMDTHRFKIGDGVSTYSELGYYVEQDEISAMIQAAIDELIIESGSDLGRELFQNTPSSNWSFVVPAGMNRRPSVTIFDADGKMVFADIEATDTTVHIQFPSPVTGSIVLS